MSVPPDRFAEPAGWILATLRRGPSSAAGLLDSARAEQRRLRPGTLFAVLARLERATVIERLASDAAPMYRLASHRTEERRWIGN